MRGLAVATLFLAVRPAHAEVLTAPEHLASFFSALAGLRKGTAKHDAIVTVWGDSHTAADGWTGVLRSELQARFGSGGRGFVSLGKPWRSHGQRQVTFANGPGCDGHSLLDREPDPEGSYGLGGSFVLCRGKRAFASTTFQDEVHTVALHLGGGPHAGSVEALFDGRVSGTRRIYTPQPSTHAWVLPVPPGVQEVAVRGRDGKPFRAYGVSAHRHEAGVVVDALGINGTRAENLERIDEVHFLEAVARRKPTLLVFAYGTNEAGDDGDLTAYAERLQRIVLKVRRGRPSASCLLVGPPDRSERVGDHWETMARLLTVAEHQRRVAAEVGCAFFDTLTAIGGPGTLEVWSQEDPPRAQRDHVHYTWSGYATWGQSVADALLAAFERHAGR